MPAEVHFWRLPQSPGSELAPADPRPALRRLVRACGLPDAGAPPRGRSAGGGTGWVLKVALGAPGRPAPVAPEWAREVAAALAGTGDADLPAGSVVIDTLSIATRGLETPAGLREAARAKGYGTGGDLPFRVADDPEGPPPWPAPLSPPGSAPGAHPAGALGTADHAVAGVLADAAGLALLTPLRPHPHLGIAGSVAALGLDLADRAAKLRLHGGIRPKVDTPLCAGCGSCLDVCLYDAIVIRGGRAVIDHVRCTGCGECMGVCFMAGIAPEDAAGLSAFQESVGAAAVATAGLFRRVPARPMIYLNFLVQLDSHAAAARARRRLPVAGLGILASRDPVAADSAAFDLLSGHLGAPLNQWSGYTQAPGPLLDRAALLGLGSREYVLREV